MIINATLEGAKENVKVIWKERISRLQFSGSSSKGFPQKDTHTWKYKASNPAAIEVYGEPSSQVTINGTKQFLNEEKVFVLEWVAPLEIKVVNKEINLGYKDKYGAYLIFTILFRNTSKNSIDLKDLKYCFQASFKEDYKMPSISFLGSAINRENTVLEAGADTQLTIGEALYGTDSKKFILNTKKLSQREFISQLESKFQGLEFQALDKKGAVIGEFY